MPWKTSITRQYENANVKLLSTRRSERIRKLCGKSMIFPRVTGERWKRNFPLRNCFSPFSRAFISRQNVIARKEYAKFIIRLRMICNGMVEDLVI